VKPKINLKDQKYNLGKRMKNQNNVIVLFDERILFLLVFFQTFIVIVVVIVILIIIWHFANKILGVLVSNSMNVSCMIEPAS